jgi:pterin-4a-carbinolamine dehydratase
MTTQDVVVSRFLQVAVSRSRMTAESVALTEVDAELKPERVQLWLAANPEWRLGATEPVLHRTRTFQTEGAAMGFAAYVSSLAVSMSLPAMLEIREMTVQVSLSSPRARRRAPLTEKILTLASLIG